MQNNLFIPKTLKIGFQARSDTFTGKLAYVIYFDEKGKLRKESSWESWRDKNIPTLELENKPLPGFVLNKGVQRSREWGSGRSVIRVHDPREFEFEISVDNLIGLLMHSDVSKRDIVEPCVFAWAGTELVLLPVNSEAYQASVAFTAKQDQKVSTKTLVQGRRYTQKKSETLLTYIGYFPWFVFENKDEETNRQVPGNHVWGRQYITDYYRTQVNKGKKHVFFDGSQFVVPSVSVLSGEASPDIVDDYAALVDAFYHTLHSQAIVDVAVDLVEPVDFTPDGYSSELYRIAEDKRSAASIFLSRSRARYHGEMVPGQSLRLSGRSFSLRLTPAFHTIQPSHGTPHVETLPFSVTGTSRHDAECAELHTSCEPGWSATVTYSAKVMTELRSRGYGVMYYILENGNRCAV